MQCPVCGKDLAAGRICECGYDPTRDYEHHPTLTLVTAEDRVIPDQTEHEIVEAVEHLKGVCTLVEKLENDPFWMAGFTSQELGRYCKGLECYLETYRTMKKDSAGGPSDSNGKNLAKRPVPMLAIGMNHYSGMLRNGQIFLVHDAEEEAMDEKYVLDLIQMDADPWRNAAAGLRADGTAVMMWSDGLPPVSISGFDHLKQIGVGGGFTIGLKKNSTVVFKGNAASGMQKVSGWKQIRQISVGCTHALGLRHDGTVMACGRSNAGECRVSEWKNVIQVAAGWFHSVGLHTDGTVSSTVSDEVVRQKLSAWRGIVSIGAGADHTVGLCLDGKVVAAGSNVYGQCDVQDWTDITEVYARCFTTIGIRKDGTVVAAGKFAEQISNQKILVL